jgi:6-phosphofructokinase 1
MRVGLLTGGGDCPGLNSVIRTVAKTLMLQHRAEIIGIENGYEGLVEGRWRNLSYDDVSGIFTRAGTILGTSNRANPFDYQGRGDCTKELLRHFKKLKLSCLILTGGDGTLTISHQLSELGVPIVGIPKTIDNDVTGTDLSFGFYSAAQLAADALESLKATSDAHSRVMIVEIMGRHAGWLTLTAGVAAASDVILLPEIPFERDALIRFIRERHRRRRFTIVAVAEGAHERGKGLVLKAADKLGGIGRALTQALQPKLDHECRDVVLGHLQRSAKPTAFDRVLAVQFSARAVELALAKKFGRFVTHSGGAIGDAPLSVAAQGQRTVPPNYWMIRAARDVGTAFGD